MIKSAVTFTFKKLLLHILVAGYLIGAFFWTMPSETPIKSRSDEAFRSIFRPLGLWQAWDMFSPNPRNDDVYCDARIVYDDGSTETWNLSRMAHMGYYERYRRERWRKFFNDRMRVDERKNDWPKIGDWMGRDIESRTNKKPASITLARHWRPSKPGLIAVTPDSEGWKHHDFYTWTQPSNAPAGVNP
jgi:hypothetical protein